MQKKLYRSPKDGIVLGVSSGLGHYFDKDPVIVRLIFVVLFFVTGYWPMLLAYFVMFVIVPVDPAQAKVETRQEPRDVTGDEPGPQVNQEEKSEESPAPEPENRDEPVPTEHMDSSQNM
jgi:phage shock protein C